MPKNLRTGQAQLGNPWEFPRNITRTPAEIKILLARSQVGTLAKGIACTICHFTHRNQNEVNKSPNTTAPES